MGLPPTQPSDSERIQARVLGLTPRRETWSRRPSLQARGLHADGDR